MKYPIFEGLKQYTGKNRISFHMPGHKGKRDASLADFYALDITELPDTDDLHAPERYIAESERMLRTIYGTSHSFYLLGGATCSIYAMIFSSVRRGDRIIVDRGCHKSVINALTLTGAEPVYIDPDRNHQFGFTGGMNPAKLGQVISQNPHAKAVLVTSPTYYGAVSDICAIADAAHQAGMLLLVDEAHGAHLPFFPALPDSAVCCGADMVVQSVHKTLGALSGGALLHIVSDRIDPKAVRTHLAMFQTSSPCYAALAALERAVLRAQELQKSYSALIARIEAARAQVNATAKAYWVGPELADSCSIHALDPTRIIVNFSKLPLSGYDVARLLREKHKIEVEMADAHNIVCIATPYNDDGDIKQLAKAICSIIKKITPSPDFGERRYDALPLTQKIPLWKAFESEGEIIHMEHAAGRCAKQIVCKYPPGAPLLCPGEEITLAHIREIIAVLDAGGTVTGIEPDYHIEVVKER